MDTLMWRTDFDLCALCLQVMFAVLYYRRKKMSNMATRAFEIMFGILMLSTMLEYASVMSDNYALGFPEWLYFILDLGYSTGIVIWSSLFSLYVYLITNRGVYSSIKTIHIGFIPCIIMTAIIFSSPITHLVIYYLPDGTTVFGPLYSFIYIVSVMYVLGALVFSIIYSKYTSLAVRMGFWIYVSVVLLGAVWQFTASNFLVVNFLGTLGMVLMFFVQQKDYESLDLVSHLYGKDMFLLEINDRISRDATFAIIGFFVGKNKNNAADSDSFLTNTITSELGEFLLQNYGIESSFALGYGNFAVFTDSALAEENINRIKNRFLDGFGSDKEVVQPCGCCLKYPTAFGDKANLPEVFERMMSLAAKLSSDTFVNEDNFYEEREALVKRLQDEQAELERRTQEAEDAKEKAEAADRAKGTFLAHISHEMRTPLTTIMGMTEILLRGKLSESARVNSESIYSAGKSMLQIINDVLDFSKIERGKFEIIPEQYNFASTMENVINVVKVRIGKRPIKFYVDIAPDMPSVLMGDETRLKQVFANILSNAVKYTDEGSVTLKVDWNAQDSELQVAVTDTGRGIKKEDMSKLFGSFERLDVYANKTIEGAGLGLSITKQILELMGGSIAVESEVGKGSTFSFRLKQGVVNAAPVAGVSDAGGKNVLVMLKNDNDRRKLTGILSALGVQFSSTEVPDVLHNGHSFTHVLTDPDGWRDFKNDNAVVEKDKIRVVLLPWEDDSEEQSGRDYVAISYPVCTISVANAFVNEAVDNHTHGTAMQYFIAPEARILVVDDNSFNRTIASELMEPHKIIVEQAESGRDCIELVKQRHYDLIFLDHMMPVMDGIETLKILKGLDSFKQSPVPVIAFTANAVSGMKEEFLQTGFTDFLSKPINVERLESMLTHYLPKDRLQNLSREEFERLNKAEEENGSVGDYDISRIEIIGADIAKGLEGVGNSVDKFFKLLRVIVREGENVINRLSSTYISSDIKNYTIEVHALKSTMASIGAMKLSGDAKALEMAGREENVEFIASNHDALMRDYEEILKSIAKAVNEYDEFIASISTEGSSKLLEELAEMIPDYPECITSIKLLMGEFEYESASRLTQLYSRLLTDEVQKENMKLISEKFEVYDYDGAEAVINSLES